MMAVKPGESFGGKRVLAFAIAALLAISMCPVPAFATKLAAGSATDSTDKSISTQAAKKTVYVLTSVKSDYTGHAANPGYTSTTDYKLSYNSAGLLKGMKYATHPSTGSGITDTIKWSYNKKNQLTGKKNKYFKANFALNKNGTFKKCTYRINGGKYIATYAYKKGKLSSMTTKNTASKSSSTYKYTYKNGRIVAAKGPYTRTYEYDGKGNLKKSNVTNSYSADGLLVSRVLSDAHITYEYSYKPIKVNSALASKVTAQQWGLINGNVNFTVRMTDSNGYAPSVNI